MRRKSLNELIVEFLTAYRAQNRSPHTIKAYTGDLRDFLYYLEHVLRIEAPRAKDFQRKAVKDFVEHLYRRNFTRETIGRKLAAVRSLSRFAAQEGLLRDDPAASVRGPRRINRPPESPTERQVMHLLDGPLPGSTFEQRDRLMLEMLYGACGLRVSELVAVDLDDLSADELLVHGKGNRERRVFISEPVRIAVANYLPIREKLLTSWHIKQSALFVGISPHDRGQRLTSRSVHRIVRTIGQRKGIPGMRPHLLRHAFGQHCFDRGASLAVVSRLMGHARLATTAEFYVGGSVTRMMKELKSAHPHARPIIRDESKIA